ADQNPPARLYSRGPNLPTLARVASTPQYLGLGPAAYFDPALKIPEPKPLPGQEDGFDFYPVATPEKIAWLRGAGVTHVLSYTPLSRDAWPVEPVWQGFDELLNRAWARYDE